MTIIELRPEPITSTAHRIVPDPAPRLARCRLTIDRAARSATWRPDSLRDGDLVLPLGDGPKELHALVRAVYPPAMPNSPDMVLSGRLLLVDSSGRVLARSGVLPQEAFAQAWPTDVLESSGLPVREERFRNTRLLQKRYRGAAPLWPVTSGFLWFLGTFVLLLLLLGLLGALVISVL